MYLVCEYVPNGRRVIEYYDSQEFAELLLETLNSINIENHTYVIEKHPRETYKETLNYRW